MKRLVVVLSSLLVLPAFAEVTPSQVDTDTVFSDVEYDDVDTGEVEAVEAVETVQNVAKPQASTTRKPNTSTRIAAGRTNTTRSSVSNARNSNIRSRNISVRSNTTPVRTSSVTTRRGVAARAGTITDATPVYNANSTGARASVTSRGMRAATITSASTPTVTAESTVETTTELNAMKTLTEYCQAQYASCMDNYCNVLDDNQGRCTCSKNIANYEKTETTLANATEALQDVARSIQYIGLPADQINTLFTETEAELTMKDSKDNSAIRSSLDKVKRMIVDVKSGTASTVETNSAMNFDLSGLLNFDIGSTGFDLSSFMGVNGSNTNSISNQRGESLYKTATARCKASVLNSCTAQGVDAAVITNSYDLEIDKSCLAYERALTESNQQMTQTVANAKEVLKKARLMVAQNKNSYDLRGCVSALESCMQDDYVCGSDYAGCLDPTGQFIVNGSVVIGSMPGNNTETNNTSNMSTTYSHENLFSTWNVSNTDKRNPWYTASGYTPTSSQSSTPAYITLVDYIDQTVTSNAAQNSSDKMSAYLQNKIGWHDSKNNKDYGMCMSILNKCQDYTYDKKGKYDPENEVVKQFLQRALVQIKTTQDELLANYAESCISDVSSCLTSNNYDSSNPTSTKSRTAINSCYSQIKTCLSVNGNIFGNIQYSIVQDWVTGNYSNIDVWDSNSAIEVTCGTKDQDECTSTWGYCASANNGSLTTITNACMWNTSSNKCVRNTNNTNARCN